ncbi:MAG: PASTA domain-containing protein [Ruminococcus sp.]|nr:PASTA domain-containing protein [Ruminococcus sp.]
MKKTKIAAIVSAVLTPFMLCLAIALGHTIYLPPEQIKVMPDLTGFVYEECKPAYAKHFDLVVAEEIYSAEYPAGTIISHTPMAGQEYLPGITTVKCFLSKGVRMTAVPNFIGLDFEDIKPVLEESFTVSVVSEYSDEVPKGKIIATDPPEFEKAVYWSEIKVTVSGGKEPDVTE